jgi:type I restriction-modification system DNA methylase subunit
MFIYFLQKKGWLSFDGDTNYLRRLFTEAESNIENFYRERLRWLFFSGLGANENVDLQKSKILRNLRGDVPYLNGGLFEKDADGYDEADKVKIENNFFGEILDLFELYNFTVDESTPTDVEVAIDPEILGKVFEELVTGRHESGSYYTPRPIVSFMCRESLKHYLAAQDTREAIAEFVDEGNGENLSNPEAILDALKRIRVCDPACGSGAYLLGMMQELLRLRELLFVSKRLGDESLYNRKREIIENNIYGVDKDRFAVQIASLRLWLSLSIDSDKPRALPNLKYKIGCGDSLLAPMEKDFNLFRSPLIEQFKLRKADYSGADSPESKAEIDEEIERLRVEIAQSLHHLPEQPKPFQIMLAEREVQPLRDKVQRLINSGDKPKAEREQKNLNTLLTSIEEWKKQINVEHYDTGEIFDWTVEFAEVFADGGFDVVMANPPYIRQELLGRDYKENKLKPNFAEVYSGTADIYVYFFARANAMLRTNGVGCFISSNKWLRAGYGEKLRQHLLDQTKFHLVVDFGDLPVFKATAYPSIFLWQNAERKKTPTAWAEVKDLELCYQEGVGNHVAKVAHILPAEQFGTGKARIASTASASLRGQMESKGQPLKEYVKGEIYYGIKTGLNEAFVIDRETRDKLIAEDKRSAEIIKPFLSGNEVRRFEIHSKEDFLLYIPWELKIEDYPAVLNHLTNYKSALMKRAEAAVQRHPWYALTRYGSSYFKSFEKPKIIYPVISTKPRFSFDEHKFYGNDKVFFLAVDDFYLLGVLNSQAVFDWVKQTLSPLRGGFYEFRSIFMEKLPIPNASDDEREAVARLAKETQNLHARRRAKVEQFLRDIGTSPAQSSSRSVLEKPWELSEEEFLRRTKSQLLITTFRRVKDSTIDLTEQTVAIEREIDRRVAALYGVKLETDLLLVEGKEW